MSSNQFSEKPLPPEKKKCTRCGEVMPADATRCWLCLEPIQVGDATGQVIDRKATPSMGLAAWIGFAVLFTGVGTVLAMEMPGLFFVLLILGLFILAWLEVRSRNRLAAAEPGSVPQRGQSDMIVLAVAFLLAVACFIAFFVICFPGALWLTGQGK